MRYLEIHDRGWHDDYFIVRDELPACVDATLLPIRHRFWERCRIYGEDGSLWRFEPVDAPKRTFVLWLKAVTLNPRYPLRRSYHRIGEYDFRDLRAKMQERLDTLIGELGYTREDEERLESEENLESEEKLANAQTFDDIVQAVRDFLPNRRPVLL